MNAIWWIPTAVLAFGSSLLVWRLRVLEQQVAASARAVARVHHTGSAVHSLAEAARQTRIERIRVAGILAPGSDR